MNEAERKALKIHVETGKEHIKRVADEVDSFRRQVPVLKSLITKLEKQKHPPLEDIETFKSKLNEAEVRISLSGKHVIDYGKELKELEKKLKEDKNV